jgi:hypothetical protein
MQGAILCTCRDVTGNQIKFDDQCDVRRLQMNSNLFSSLRISPLHLQQGLFASLTLMVTLIVIQQFSQWSAAREATPARQPFTYSQSFTHASASVARDTALNLTPVDRKAPADEMKPQQTWVF